MSGRLCKRGEAGKLKDQTATQATSPSETDSAFLGLFLMQSGKKIQASPKAAFLEGVLGCKEGRCARIGVSVGQRRRCLPDTLKGSHQAFCNAGRSHHLINQVNLKQQRKDATELLSTTLSIVIV